MGTSHQEQGGDVRNAGPLAGAAAQVEQGNGDLSATRDASASNSGQDNNSVGGGGGGARYKLRSPAQLPISRSPCFLTIPPGLSPTSFLESPVLLSNIKAEPSPTTGSFSLSKMMQGSSDKAAATSLAQNYTNVAAYDQSKSDMFEFQFDSGPSAATSPPLPMASSSFQLQYKDNADILHENFSRSTAPSSSIKSELPIPQEVSAPSMLTSSNMVLDSDMSNHRGRQNCGTQAFSSNYKDTDDGYNWRKYGQKLVKGSEFPRSYYKCTYADCEVRKICERYPDGLIKEIVYKGTHDHPKPQSNRRHTGSAVISRLEENVDRDPSVHVLEDNANGDTQIDYLEQASTPALSPQPENEDVSDPTLQLQAANEGIDDDSPFSKKRKLDGALDETFVVKPIREPRVVVQTLSEIDILDDGYRWRKYGQKVVRGNPNPRSYYKCTSAGCSVRKHVERAAHDPKAVITTYEGKHNHEVPTARMNSHEHAGLPAIMNRIKRTRSGENVSNSIANHEVGMGYMQNIQPTENSRLWPMNFIPTFQSIFPVE